MTAQHHDLAAAPFRPSRVLVDFVAARQQQRQERQAASEQHAAMAQFRRFGNTSGQPRRKALDAAMATLPQPAFGMVSGQRSFAAAGTDRLTSGWMAINTGINTDLEAALATLRARSRDWFMNTDMGARYGDLVADNIVGCDPPRLQVRALLADNKTMDEAANTAVEAAWAEWCNKPEVTGRLNFGQVCRNVAVGTARDGEFLARRLRNKSLMHGYALQLLDVDRIDTAQNVAPAVQGGNAIRLGIEIDALGSFVAAWLTQYHPGDFGAGIAPQGASNRVLADQLLHGFVQHRPEQVRGYPWTSAVLRRANMLARYEEYAMVAAKIGAAKMGFYVTDKDVLAEGMNLEDLKDATGQLVQDVEAGMMEALPPGVSFESFNPDYPHQNYGTFVDQGKRDLAAGLSVAHHNLSGNMNGVNYSSARIAEMGERLALESTAEVARGRVHPPRVRGLAALCAAHRQHPPAQWCAAAGGSVCQIRQRSQLPAAQLGVDGPRERHQGQRHRRQLRHAQHAPDHRRERRGPGRRARRQEAPAGALRRARPARAALALGRWRHLGHRRQRGGAGGSQRAAAHPGARP